MRWLIVSNQHHPKHGGIGASVASICTAAARAGWDMHLLTVPSRHALPGVAMQRITSPDMISEFAAWIEPLRKAHAIRPYRYGLWALEVAHWLETCEVHFDAIEFVDCQAQSVAAIDHAGIHPANELVPRLIHAHTPMFVGERFNDVDTQQFGRSTYHQWEQACIDAADGLGTAGAHLDAHIHRASDVTIPPLVCRADAMIRPVDTPPRQHIVYLGSLEQRKGADIGFDAVCEVLKDHARVEASFIGPDTLTGPGESSMTAHLQSRMPAALRSRITFTGAVPHADVMNALAQAAVVIVPSRFDSFNIVAAEAIMRGVPVVASPHVGIVHFAPSIHVCQSLTVAALRAGLNTVLNDAKRAAQRVRAAQLELQSACSWQAQETNRRRWLDIARGRAAHASRSGELRRAVLGHLRSIEARVSTENKSLNLTRTYLDSS
jgi:glycosyltransferase involved in cell wall biosynthesis